MKGNAEVLSCKAQATSLLTLTIIKRKERNQETLWKKKKSNASD